MTLSSHLKSPDSPIRKYLEQTFPILQLSTRGSPNAKAYSSILGFDNLAPCSLPTLAPRSNPGTIGTAVDYRLRYYFRSYDPHETVASRCVGKLRGQSILTRNTPPDMDVMAKQLHDRRSDFSIVAKSLNRVQQRIPAG